AEGSNKIADELNIKDYTYPIDYLARTTITTLITYNDLVHLSPVELLISHFIKAYYCFMFLEEGKHNDLVALFLKPYGVTSWQEYLKHLLPIMNAAVIQKDDSGLYYFNIENSADPAKTKILFEHLALNQEESYPIKPDFLHARASPLFKTEENRYLIMDPVLTVNRLYNSIFFELLRIAEANSYLNPKYASFFSLYTFDFIEKFLSYSLLNKIYNKTQCYKLSGQEIKKKFSVESEPDYYVRKGNKVFLFEVKGSIVTGIAKQSFSYLKIEKELKSKYLFDEKDKQNKAIRQLVERIITLFEGKAKYDEAANARTIRIFPILLVSEIALTTPATNFLLNQWFKAGVDKNDLLRNNKHRICDLVIIDLDTLILYSQVFEENNNLLETMILKYYAAVAQKKIRPAKGIEFNEQFITMQMQKSFIPFSDFLRDELKIKAPDIFIEF
ncbi:MAG TPA: hypothetical protein PLN99_14100, partial [Daejeonella sp.]|nr:hypothetical protein [Daejeonella sp.]